MSATPQIRSMWTDVYLEGLENKGPTPTICVEGGKQESRVNLTLRTQDQESSGVADTPERTDMLKRPVFLSGTKQIVLLLS